MDLFLQLQKVNEIVSSIADNAQVFGSIDFIVNDFQNQLKKLEENINYSEAFVHEALNRDKKHKSIVLTVSINALKDLQVMKRQCSVITACIRQAPIIAHEIFDQLIRFLANAHERRRKEFCERLTKIWSTNGEYRQMITSLQLKQKQLTENNQILLQRYLLVEQENTQLHNQTNKIHRNLQESIGELSFSTNYIRQQLKSIRSEFIEQLTQFSLLFNQLDRQFANYWNKNQLLSETNQNLSLKIEQIRHESHSFYNLFNENEEKSTDRLRNAQITIDMLQSENETLKVANQSLTVALQASQSNKTKQLIELQLNYDHLLDSMQQLQQLYTKEQLENHTITEHMNLLFSSSIDQENQIKQQKNQIDDLKRQIQQIEFNYSQRIIEEQQKQSNLCQSMANSQLTIDSLRIEIDQLKFQLVNSTQTKSLQESKLSSVLVDCDHPKNESIRKRRRISSIKEESDEQPMIGYRPKSIISPVIYDASSRRFCVTPIGAWIPIDLERFEQEQLKNESNYSEEDEKIITL